MPLYESVAKLPILEQPAEIDRRITAEYNKRLAQKLPLTPAHIQMVCGISKTTYREWRESDSNARINGGFVHPEFGDNQRRSPEEHAAILERRELLLVWESVCASMLADTANDSNSKSAVTGANFQLERALGYQRDGGCEAAAANAGLEAILARIAVRLATGDKKTAEIGADMALVNLPTAPAADEDQDEADADIIDTE